MKGTTSRNTSGSPLGGTDDFEAKFSLTPLIFGTLKGTFYAMLFAGPIALLSALYASQFMHPTLKGVVKPVVEIMAAHCPASSSDSSPAFGSHPWLSEWCLGFS